MLKSPNLFGRGLIALSILSLFCLCLRDPLVTLVTLTPWQQERLVHRLLFPLYLIPCLAVVGLIIFALGKWLRRPTPGNFCGMFFSLMVLGSLLVSFISRLGTFSMPGGGPLP